MLPIRVAKIDTGQHQDSSQMRERHAGDVRSLHANGSVELNNPVQSLQNAISILEIKTKGDARRFRGKFNALDSLTYKCWTGTLVNAWYQ